MMSPSTATSAGAAGRAAAVDQEGVADDEIVAHGSTAHDSIRDMLVEQAVRRDGGVAARRCARRAGR